METVFIYVRQHANNNATKILQNMDTKESQQFGI
jgi:hypothetical protein